MLTLHQMRPAGIAVVDVQGMIGPAVRPLEYARLLMKLRDDHSVRAVLLNIDSPGGSATGSEIIMRAVLRLRERKPVAAYVSGLGASGGYMIAAAAHRVFALPSALLGAIGVISYRPLVGPALERLGVTMHVAKSGRLKDMLSPFREPTVEELEKEQHILDAMYDIFVEGVAEHRGLSIERARELATGEIYPAAEALRHGLIDETGDMEDAVDWIVAESGAPRRLRVARPRRTLRDLLTGRGAASLGGSLLMSVVGGALMRDLHAGGVMALYSGPRS